MSPEPEAPGGANTEAEAKPAAPEAAEKPSALESTKEAIDYQALYNAEVQKRKSLEGNVVKQRDRDAAIRRNLQLTEVLIDHLSNPDADPANLRARVAQVDAQENQAVSSEQFNRRSETLRTSINRKLAAFALSPEVEPRLTDAFNLWKEAGSRTDFDGLLDAASMVDSIVAEYAGSTKKRVTAAEAEVEKAKKAKKAEELNLESGKSVASPGNLSLDALSKVDTRGWSLKKLQEHDQQLDAAMRRGA